MPKKKSKTIYHLIGNNRDAGATEYIKPGGKINITSHGLGSGIYGLSIPSYKRKKQYLPFYLSEGKKLVVKIDRPYILTSNEHCNSLIRWSTAINDTLQKFKKKFLSGLKKEREERGVKPREKLTSARPRSSRRPRGRRQRRGQLHGRKPNPRTSQITQQPTRPHAKSRLHPERRAGRKARDEDDDEDDKTYLSLKLISSLCATQFNKFSERKLTAKKCRTALRKFLKDYSSRKDYVCMPINYILGELRYDGIYAGGTSCDSMSKGNIKFMCPYEKAKTVLINKIKVRTTGVKNKVIILRDFINVKGKFLRGPPRFTPEHTAWLQKHGIAIYTPRRWSKGRKAKK